MIDTATTSPAIGAVTVVSIFIDSSDGERVTGDHRVARLDQRTHDQRRPSGAHRDAVLALDDVRVGSQFDAESRVGRDHDQPMPTTTAGDPAFVARRVRRR